MASDTYRSAGVDIDACDAWLERLRGRVPAIGGFAGLFPIGGLVRGMKEPCLVSGTDGVGTKVLVARAAGDLSTVGIDCVAMVVNDILCCGARTLFFLDYLAVGAFDADEADALIEGVRTGCAQAGCELIGGETAELPGLFGPRHFDLAGFGVGIVDKAKAIDGSRIRVGDVVVGLPSTGLHSNGFSLARRVLGEYQSDVTVAREMLAPTRIYVKPVLALAERVEVKGIAHITGAGLPGNLCRVLPPNIDARLDPARWERPAIFDKIASRGGVEPAEMFKTFNMGIGLCVVVDARNVAAAVEGLAECGARPIGEIVPGAGNVQIVGEDA